MGQGFVFVNKNKMEYIDSTISSSARFKSMINDDLISKLITRLVCVSNNDDYKKYKKRNIYAQRYMGSWSGDVIEIMGDYQQEIELREVVYKTGKNIVLEVAAMFFDQEEEELTSIIEQAKNSTSLFMFLAEIALLPDCPKGIIYAIETNMNSEWKAMYYKKLYS